MPECDSPKSYQRNSIPLFLGYQAQVDRLYRRGVEESERRRSFGRSHQTNPFLPRLFAQVIEALPPANCLLLVGQALPPAKLVPPPTAALIPPAISPPAL